MRDLWVLLRWVVGAIALLFLLGMLISALSYGSYRFWAPKQEEARREVFEQTPSYVHGKRQYLTRLHGEWMRADSAGKRSICFVARHEASTIDEKHLTPTLQAWECTK